MRDENYWHNSPMNYRNRKLLNFARGQPCMMRIPGVCNHNHETTVAAHSNRQRHGKGTGIKAHDYFIVWACSDCHAWYDQGKSPQLEKEMAWIEAWERTIAELFEQGLIGAC